MPGRDDVCVVIPTLNEAPTIGAVIDGFHAHNLEDVVVIDGHSTDDTRRIARDHGAAVLVQSGRGKGQAVREALRTVDAEIIVLVDGDGTYLPEDVDEMLAPILEDEAEHVIGNRFAGMESGAMSRLNQVGNRLINRVFRVIHGEAFKDILSGYRAFTMASVERSFLSADGFGIETELAVECVKHGIPTAVVPIRYRSRPGGSEANLRPFRDGGIILLTLYQLAKTNNPLFYFGSAGGLSVLGSIGLALFVGIEWVTRGIAHEVLAIVAGFALLLGLQLVMFGVLSDMVLALHREQLRHIE